MSPGADTGTEQWGAMGDNPEYRDMDFFGLNVKEGRGDWNHKAPPLMPVVASLLQTRRAGHRFELVYSSLVPLQHLPQAPPISSAFQRALLESSQLLQSQIGPALRPVTSAAGFNYTQLLHPPSTSLSALATSSNFRIQWRTTLPPLHTKNGHYRYTRSTVTKATQLNHITHHQSKP